MATLYSQWRMVLRKEKTMYEIYGKLEEKDWELIDTAEDKEELDYMLAEYKLAFGSGWKWKIKDLAETK